jgi:hypothetical protein
MFDLIAGGLGLVSLKAALIHNYLIQVVLEKVKRFSL